MERPRKKNDGRLPKAARNCKTGARNRRRQPLTTWDHDVEQAVETFEPTDEDAVDRDRTEFSDQRICLNWDCVSVLKFYVHLKLCKSVCSVEVLYSGIL